MGGLFIGLASIAFPVWGIYKLRDIVPLKDFINLSTTTKSILFHPTWDIMLMFFVVAAVFLYAISTGRGRVALILLNTYISYGIASFLFLQKSFFGISVPHGSIPKIIVFGSVFFVVLFFLFRAQFGSLIRSGMRDIAWWNALVLSVMESGLLSSFLYTFLSPPETNLLAPLTKLLIGTPEIELLWIVTPFLWFAILNFFKRE